MSDATEAEWDAVFAQLWELRRDADAGKDGLRWRFWQAETWWYIGWYLGAD